MAVTKEQVAKEMRLGKHLLANKLTVAMDRFDPPACGEGKLVWLRVKEPGSATSIFDAWVYEDDVENALELLSLALPVWEAERERRRKERGLRHDWQVLVDRERRGDDDEKGEA